MKTPKLFIGVNTKSYFLNVWEILVKQDQKNESCYKETEAEEKGIIKQSSN